MLVNVWPGVGAILLNTKWYPSYLSEPTFSTWNAKLSYDVVSGGTGKKSLRLGRRLLISYCYPLVGGPTSMQLGHGESDVHMARDLSATVAARVYNGPVTMTR